MQCQNEECPLFNNTEFRIIGRGHSAADTLASVLNLHKPVNKSPWLSHTKPLTEKAEGPGN